MLKGDAETKDNFKYLSKHGIRAIASIFLSNPKQIDELVNSVPEDVLTGYHLRDIFDSTKKPNEIRRKIYDTILFNKRFPKTLEISKQIVKSDENKEEEEKKKKPQIDFDLTKFFTDLGALDCINKLQKQDLNDPELFFKVTVDQIEACLELKPEGKKVRIMKKIKEVKEKFDKEGKIEYLDQGLLDDVEAPQLKFIKSTSIRETKRDKL